MQIEPADERTATRPPTDLETNRSAADAGNLEELELVKDGTVVRRSPLLLPIIFISGVSIMATQMCGSRVIQWAYGSSLLIWANLIGFTMICLAAGYYLGGRLSVRYPRPATLFLITGLAAIGMAFIPLLSHPVVNVTTNAGLFSGSLLSIILLLTVPLLLLGSTSPFAVRLLINSAARAGRTAGTVSSLNTVGSILGTFLPVLWIMPSLGTDLTVYLFAALLLVFSAVGLLLSRRPAAPVTLPASTEVKPAPGDPLIQNSKFALQAAPGGKIQNSAVPFLLPIIFICGMAVMATEMCASRLIQPYFGDSLLIWASLIGFIIIYLAIGYYLGGRLGDRFPRPGFLYQLTGVAALAMGLVPALSSPILTIAGQGFKSVDGGMYFGALFGIILLFSVPVIFLGCVSPFAIRLLVHNVQDAGRTAGKVSSLSTVGSILGTFLPVLVFIPTVGTRNTLYIFSLTLLGFSTIGLFLTSRRRAPIFAALLIAVLAMNLFFTFSIKSAPYGKLLMERESAYNYIQVVQRDDGQVDLVLNEGHAVHSIYNPAKILTNGPWDYYMVTPFFNSGLTEKDVKSCMLIGLGAGTVPKQLTKAYGSQIHIEGIEIDPAIIEAGRKYFDMNEPNLNAIAEDGRYALITSKDKFDIIGVDAYKQPYIPFHLTTREFFQEVRDHLTPTGVAVINAGSPAVNGKIDYRLAEALAATMKTVYPNVYMINLYNISGFFNTIVVATNQPTRLETFKQNIRQYVSNDLIKQVGTRALDKDSVREWTGKTDGPPPPVFTDDWAPVERIIDQVIIDYVTGGGR